MGEVRKGGVEVEGQLVSGVAGVRSLQAVGGGGSALGQAVGGVRKAGEEDRGGRWADDTKVAARRSGGGGWRWRVNDSRLEVGVYTAILPPV